MVVWRRADRQIIRFNGATGYGVSVVNGSKLHLTKVSRKHMSEYVCVASNGIPPDESWTVKLHVTFEPIVIPQNSILEHRRGSHVRLLFDSNKYSTEQAVVEKYKSVHILEIKELQPEQFGVYKCVAGNDYGSHYAEIRLIETSWRSGLPSDTEADGDDATNIDINEVSTRRRSNLLGTTSYKTLNDAHPSSPWHKTPPPPSQPGTLLFILFPFFRFRF
uniref:Ig-like domain-containing protein n=1 Tax=Panagrolaimus sp. PS1159 TaxID=55785 RepID=A0AC35G1U4_9BILA